MDSLYDKKHTCPFCEREFTSKRVKVGKIRIKKVEEDFCTHYQGENPNYYSVLICPWCGYTYSSQSSKIKDAEKDSIEEFLQQNPLKGDYSGARDHSQALKAFQRALELGEWRKEKSSALANYSMHMAWIYRYLEDWEGEVEYSEKALQYLLDYYERGSQEGNPAKTMYILGELNRRLGREREAVMWYNKIVNDKEIRDAAIIKKAREQWKNMRDT